MTIAKISLHGILNSHLNEKTILAFCYKVVLRIVLKIYPHGMNKFNDKLPILGGIHIAKDVFHGLGKYIKGCVLDNEV